MVDTLPHKAGNMLSVAGALWRRELLHLWRCDTKMVRLSEEEKERVMKLWKILFVSLIIVLLFALTYVAVAEVTGGADRFRGFVYAAAEDFVTG